MQKKIAPVLAIMLDEIEGIQEAIADKSFQDYCDEWALRRAVQRAIEIITEASKRLPADLLAKHPEINWSQVRGIGNVLRHEYHKVQDQVIWNIASEHLPPLEAALLDMQDKLSE